MSFWRTLALLIVCMNISCKSVILAPTRDALVFNGRGTDSSNARSLEDLLEEHHFTYEVADSARISQMTSVELGRFGMIVWPGGDSNEMTDELAPKVRGKIRAAVRSGGVSYIGFCAGAWMAVGPTPTGLWPEWGLSIVNADYLKGYDPNGSAPDPTAALVKNTFADGSSRYLVWWDSPALPEISGGVFARYPDGTPSIVQTMAGEGFVLLSGPHPEAPQSWRDVQHLKDPDGLDLDIAWRLLESARAHRRSGL